MTQTEAYMGLADAVVIQATLDWRALCKNLIAKKPKAEIVRACETFDSLRLFFKGQWCEGLCRGVSPSGVLDGLERELTETNKILNGGK